MAYSNIINYNTGKRNVYILGTGEFGKTNIPTLIENETQLHSIYGATGTIVEGFLQAKGGSFKNNIFGVKVSGTHSSVHLNVNIPQGEIVEKCIILKSKYSNEIYNNLKVIIAEESIIFMFPQELGGGYREYVYEDYQIFGLLMKEINEDTDNNLNMVYMQCAIEPSTPLANSLTSVNGEQIYMSGGYSGLNIGKDNYYYNLENTYNLLEGENIDIIVPLGAYIDDIKPSNLGIDLADLSDATVFYPEGRDYLTLKYEDMRAASYFEQLVLFCIKQLKGGVVTTGVVGFNKTNDRNFYNIPSIYLHKVIVPNLIANRTNMNIRKYHQLVSIVAGDLEYNYGMGVDNGSVVYAGLLNGINASVNSTNQSFGKSVLLYNEFDEPTMNTLADIGVVSFRHSVLKDRVVVMNGVTSLEKGTDMHYYCNVKMIQLTITAINDLMNSYMGENINNLIDNLIINQDLDMLILQLTINGVIDKCVYEVVRNKEDNNVFLYLELKTRYMIEGIKKSIRVNYNV